MFHHIYGQLQGKFSFGKFCQKVGIRSDPPPLVGPKDQLFPFFFREGSPYCGKLLAVIDPALPDDEEDYDNDDDDGDGDDDRDDGEDDVAAEAWLLALLALASLECHCHSKG